MKKFSYLILTLIFILIICFEKLEQSSYQALEISDDCKIGIDLNHNDKITDDEYYEFEEINNFCTAENISKNEKYVGKLSDKEKIYLKILTIETYKDLFLNSLIRIDNNKITANFQNADKLVLEKGLALPDSQTENFSKYVDLSRKIIAEANKTEIYLLNTKSLKYHTLNCEKGKQSKQKKYVLKEKLPENAKPCGYCLNIQLKQPDKNFQLKSNSKEIVSTHSGITVIEEPSFGTYKPASDCSNKLCKTLKNEIDNAKESINMAIYDLDNQPVIVEALKRASKRGVVIKVATDNKTLKENKVMANNINSFADKVYDDGVSGKDAYRLMHNKFIIFDNKTVWTGSTNLTATGLSGFNANTSLIIHSKEIAKIFNDEFANFENKKFHSSKNTIHSKPVNLNDTTIEVYFSPKNNTIEKYVLPEIKIAKKYIYVPIFIITHKNMARELINAKKRGVDVKVIIDATSARNKYSQHTLLRENNIPVKTENFAGKMHMKSVIIDDKTVFTGSMNFTKSGDVYNDENCLKIENAQIAQQMKNTFLFIWKSIPDKYLKYDPKPESPESVGSCFDGVDNDFDGYIDFADSGCKILR